MKLTGRQRKFVEEYLVDMNATAAAVRAGYSPRTAKQMAHENLTKPDLRRVVDEALAVRAKRNEVKADHVVRELAMIAFSDIRELFDDKGRLLPIHEVPESARRAVASVDVEEIYEGRGSERAAVGRMVKIRFWDKLRALELLGKHLGLFVDRVEHDVGPSLEELLRESLGLPAERRSAHPERR